MKRILVLLLALGVVVLFASVAAAQKSVVSIVKAESPDLKLLAESFHFNDDISHEQTAAFHEATGEYPRAVWPDASEEVWYKYVKQAVDLAGGLPV